MDTLLPEITEGLLKALEAMYPNRCPNPSWTEREVWMAAGRAEVVTRLRQEYDAQQETS